MASEKNLNLKKEVVKEIIGKVQDSETVILFTYDGLSVADVSGLRRKLRDENAEVKVYKNTLVKLAFDDLKVNLDEFLEGQNAILFSTKLLEAIKVLSAFAKEHKNLNIRAGIIKGDVVTTDTINEYASIPSMEALLTMLAGGMIEHVKNLSIGLNLYAEKLECGKPVVTEEPKAAETTEVPAEATEEVAEASAEDTVEAEPQTEEVTESNEEN